VKYRFMLAEKANFEVTFMCRMLALARSGFYAWLKATPSQKVLEERALVVHLHEAFRQSGATYGSPRLYRELRARGHQVGRHRVARLMRREGLRPRGRPRFVRTTQAGDGAPAPNLLARDFSAEAPNKAWVADITYVQTREGWLFLAVVLDLFSRRIVGWATSRRIDHELVLKALRMAIQQRRPAPGLVHHSDRGLQYTCSEHRAQLAAHGILASMSRKGDCWDNAVAESFFSTLKIELVHRSDFLTHAVAHDALSSYIESFYNCRRMHSSIRYRSPVEHELLSA
jgi:transposase InsO family protein